MNYRSKHRSFHRDFVSSLFPAHKLHDIYRPCYLLNRMSLGLTGNEIISQSLSPCSKIKVAFVEDRSSLSSLIPSAIFSPLCWLLQ